MSIFRDIRTASSSNAAPITTAIVVAMVAGFLLSYLSIAPEVVGTLPFQTNAFIPHPWSCLTYPYILPDPISTFFICLWLWSFGGSVERDLGSVRFLGVWLLFSALSAVCVLVGAALFHTATGIHGGWCVVSAITVIWGTRNPNVTILLMFVIPIAGKWIAWLSGALVFFGTRPPQLAPFAAVPLILAYFFAANKLPFALYSLSDRRYMGGAKKWERYDKSYYEEVQRREKEREERERLRRLFEGNSRDDDR